LVPPGWGRQRPASVGPVRPAGGVRLPRRCGAGADLATDWIYWFFLFDDWFDGPLGRDPLAVRQLVGWMTDCVHGIPGGPDDLDTVTHMRRYSIGVLPSLDFGEPANGCEVDAELVGGEPLHRMRLVTADVIAGVNGAFSLGKDLAKGESTSAAVVMMRLCGWTPEQTIHHLEDTVADLIEECLALEAEARTQAARFGLPEETANVERYLQAMRDWMIANLAWSEETPRYGDHPALVAMSSRSRRAGPNTRNLAGGLVDGSQRASRMRIKDLPPDGAESTARSVGAGAPRSARVA
jgi:hypothetical protein